MGFLREVFEHYNTSDEYEREILHRRFVSLVWKSKYKRRNITKYVRYRVSKELNDDAYNMFSKYNMIPYKICKSVFKKHDLRSVDYIRIHINNLYSYLCDEELYYSKEYYDLLITPKREYFKYLNSDMCENIYDIEDRIIKSLELAEKIRCKCIKEKTSVPWTEYKAMVDLWLFRLLENYKGVNEDALHTADINGDLMITSYINKSITYYMSNYMYSLKNVKRKYNVGYIPLDNILDDYDYFQLCLGKYCSSAEELKLINIKDVKLTKKQTKLVDACKNILSNNNLKDIILFNEELVPYINHRIISDELGITRRGVSKLIGAIWLKIK